MSIGSSSSRTANILNSMVVLTENYEDDLSLNLDHLDLPKTGFNHSFNFFKEDELIPEVPSPLSPRTITLREEVVCKGRKLCDKELGIH